MKKKENKSADWESDRNEIGTLRFRSVGTSAAIETKETTFVAFGLVSTTWFSMRKSEKYRLDKTRLLQPRKRRRPVAVRVKKHARRRFVGRAAWPTLLFLLIEIGAPVGQIEDGEDQREDDARDDVDPLGAQRVRAQPGAAARLRVAVDSDPRPVTVVLVHEDDLRVGRHQRFLHKKKRKRFINCWLPLETSGLDLRTSTANSQRDQHGRHVHDVVILCASRCRGECGT